MQLTDLEDKWINSTHKSIKSINELLNSDKVYDKEFVELAKFLLETDINPWQILPTGWESSLDIAQFTESLLLSLRHALVDDGDLAWINTEVHGPLLEFVDVYEEERIKQLMDKRFRHVLPVKYTVHSYSPDFIKTLTDYETNRRKDFEKFESDFFK